MIRLPKDSAKQHTVGSMKTDILRDEIRVAIEKKLKSLKTKYPELIDGSVMTADVADLSDKLWILNLSAPQDQWRRTLELLANTKGWREVQACEAKDMGFGELAEWSVPETDTLILIDENYLVCIHKGDFIKN